MEDSKGCVDRLGLTACVDSHRVREDTTLGVAQWPTVLKRTQKVQAAKQAQRFR